MNGSQQELAANFSESNLERNMPTNKAVQRVAKSRAIFLLLIDLCRSLISQVVDYDNSMQLNHRKKKKTRFRDRKRWRR